MAQTSLPWNNTPINEAEWRQIARYFVPDGVLAGVLNELAVYGDSTGAQVKVPSGEAFGSGVWYQSSVEEIVATPNSVSQNRIDLIAVKLDLVARTGLVVRLAGTESATPIPPAYTNDATATYVPLAEVLRRVGASVAPSDVTDRRRIILLDNRETFLLPTNKSGAAVTPGAPVVLDTTNDSAFKTTTVARDPRALGVVTEVTQNNAAGKVLVNGVALVYVGATTARGDYLSCSAVAGQAQPSASQGTGDFAVALAARAGAGLVRAYVFGPMTGQVSDAQIVSVAAGKVTGQLADAQIAAVAASKITGQLADAQIAAVAGAKVSGQVPDAATLDALDSLAFARHPTYFNPPGRVYALATVTTAMGVQTVNLAASTPTVPVGARAILVMVHVVNTSALNPQFARFWTPDYGFLQSDSAFSVGGGAQTGEQSDVYLEIPIGATRELKFEARFNTVQVAIDLFGYRL